MKIIIALAAAFSVQAFACPNLTGSYTCDYGNGQTEQMTISQEERNGVTFYKYNNDEFAADGTVYPLQDSAELKQGTFKAWCESTILKNQIMGKYYNNGSYFGDLDMTMDLTLNNGNLSQVAKGSLKSANGDYPINQTVTCNKN